jgi:hydroxymethylpyrimidine pyrophosphatase-like HAD family hydrolase
MPVGMIVTDLDGTLLGSGRQLSAVDRETLVQLGRLGITRVVATGRSLFSARRVLDESFPIDYLAHTSGAGIVSWPLARELRVRHMPATAAAELAAALMARELDFMLHHAIPNNHHFYLHRGGRANADFERRVQLYADYAEALPVPLLHRRPMCQGLVIEPSPGASCYASLRDALPAFQVIRTTSPLDGSSTWIEIFPAGVSKADAAAWLVEREGREQSLSVAVGNDFNDLDLLAWADLAFVVGNAPAELRGRYATVASNDEGGFSEAVERALS